MEIYIDGHVDGHRREGIASGIFFFQIWEESCLISVKFEKDNGLGRER